MDTVPSGHHTWAELLTRVDAAAGVRYFPAGDAADSMGGKYRLVTGLTERGRRVVGIWPSEDSVDALVDALDRAADEADDPEEESKLRKLATGFRNVSKKISTAVIAAYIAGQLPK
jgi:hypothetical protein